VGVPRRKGNGEDDDHGRGKDLCCDDGLLRRVALGPENEKMVRVQIVGLRRLRKGFL
jgi:hypothetical protein